MHEKFISHSIPITLALDDDEEVLRQHQKSTPQKNENILALWNRFSFCISYTIHD